MKQFFKLTIFVILFFINVYSFGQCHTDICYDSSYFFPYTEYQNIQYTGKVCTKEYVVAYLPDGQKTSIPIINGIVPLIDHYYSKNAVIYYLNYDSGKKWSGKNPITYFEIKNETVQVVSNYNDDIKNFSFQSELKKIQESYEQMQIAQETEYKAAIELKDRQYFDTIKQLKESVEELRELVQKKDKIVSSSQSEKPPIFSSGMKKPSEIFLKGFE
jgi:hypothetical protein